MRSSRERVCAEGTKVQEQNNSGVCSAQRSMSGGDIGHDEAEAREAREREHCGPEGKKVKREMSHSEDSDDKDKGGMTFTSLDHEAQYFGYRRCTIIYLLGLPEGLVV